MQFSVLPAFLLLSVSLVFASSLNAQSVAVTGRVRDSLSQRSLEEATVSLFRMSDTVRVASHISRNKFGFENLTKGKYLLVTTYQGYRADSLLFTVGPADSTDLDFDISLVSESRNLLEVIVRATIPPVIVRHDTIAYNAGAYPSPPNSTLEDLIRKLPGVEVDADGHVTMQGKPVDKILIDGKEFFLGDLRAATQNLPSDIVASIEAFDTQTERSKLLGIKEKADSKTLNIKLKKKIRQGYVGKIEASAGTHDNYSADANLTRFRGDQWIFGTANAVTASNRFQGSPAFPGTDNGFQHSGNLQFNYRDALTKKLNLTVNGGRNTSSNLSEQEIDRQTIVPDSTITEDRLTTTRNRSTGYSGQVAFAWEIDSFTQLNIHSNYNQQSSNNASSDTVAIQTTRTGQPYLSSIGGTHNTNGGTSDSYNNSLDFRTRLHKRGRMFYINLAQTGSLQQQPATLLSLVQAFDSSGHATLASIVNQQSDQRTKSSGYNVDASYTEPIGKRHILDFNYGLNRSAGHSDKESLDFDTLTGKYDRPDSLTTNIFQNHTTVQHLSTGFNTTEGKYRFQVGLTGQLTDLYNLNLVTKVPLTQHTVNWYPRASLLWELAEGKNMNISYSGSNTPPSIDQLQPIPDLSNPYLVKVGNPDLRQQLTNNMSASYSAFNAKTFQNWQVNLNADYTQNQISSSSTVLAGGVQQIEYVNVSGVYHLSSYLTFGFPINNQKNGNASLSLHGNYGHDISLVNGQTNNAENIGVGGSANIGFHSGDKLFINAQGGVDQTRSNYSIALAPSGGTLNENFQLGTSYRLPGYVTVTSHYTLQVTGAQSTLPSHSVSMWNAAVYKTLFPKHTGEIRFSLFDLLNSASSFSQNTGVNYVQTVRSNLTGRYVLLSFVYHLKGFEG